MIRLPEFDVLNAKRTAILRALAERELGLLEICQLTGFGKNAVYYHVKILKENGLVSFKDALKKTVWAKAKNKNKNVKRWILTGNGEKALAYFSGGLH